MSKANTPTYKTLNWPAYNKALKRRGSLTIWFDPGMALAAMPSGQSGRRSRLAWRGRRGRLASVGDSRFTAVRRIRKQSGFEQKHLIRGIISPTNGATVRAISARWAFIAAVLTVGRTSPAARRADRANQ